jgi:hypothetical protein
MPIQSSPRSIIAALKVGNAVRHRSVKAHAFLRTTPADQLLELATCRGWALDRRLTRGRAGCLAAGALAPTAGQTSITSQGDGLRTAIGMELGKDTGNVVADSFRAEEELLGDLLGATAYDKEAENVPFAVRQLRQRPIDSGRDLVKKSMSDARAEDHSASGHRVDSAGDLVISSALEKVTASSGPDRGKQRLVVIVHRQDEHRDAGVRRGDTPGRLDSIEVGQLKVHDDDVGLFDGGDIHGFCSGGDCGDKVSSGQRGPTPTLPKRRRFTR